MRTKSFYSHIKPGLELILVFVLFVGLHWLLRLYTFPDNSLIVDKLCSAIFQIIGIILIVYGIDKNLKIFSGSGILQRFQEWLRIARQLLSKKGKRLGLPGTNENKSDLAGYIDFGSKPETIEDKVKYLLKEKTVMDQKINTIESRLQTEINNLTKVLNKKIALSENRRNNFDAKIKESFTGDVGTEIIGVITAGYGIAIPIIAYCFPG